ncbi:MAG: hypothetical protein HY868_19040 [Chloroflexi bacterium]|nr:hypothetical protein [Chloroflexota bacterium]
MKHFLYFILLVYLLLAALYAVNTPKWQAPDEPAHFNYIRAIGDTGSLPVLQRGDYDQDYLERIKAAKFPATMSVDAIRYEAYQPPLYYLAATPVYLIARGAGLDATVIALRLFSVALGVIVLLIAYRVVGEIFPDDNLLALATVGALATVPQHLAVSASISNDLAAELVVVLILWLAVKRINHVIGNWKFSILGGVLFGAALLTKTTTYIPGALLLISAMIASEWTSRRAREQGSRGAEESASHITHHASRNSPSAIRHPLSAFVLAALVSSPMFIRNALIYGIADPLGLARHDSVVIGQPTTAEMIAQHGLKNIVFDFFAVTFKSFWAQFGWMGVLVNDRIYVALFLLCAVAALGFALYALRILRHRESLTDAQHWGIGLLILLFGVAVADYVGYNFKFLQLQGRYLFPALIAVAFFLVIGLRELTAREYQRVVFALLYLAFIALDLACLFLFIVPQLRIAN